VTRRPESLSTDDRGAILVMGLVAAVFITALLYFLFGVGETIRHHERMNDAADAGAYATGVMHARGMNLVALANMVKLAVVTVQAAYLAMITGAILVIVWILSSKKRWIRYGWVIPFLVMVIARATSSYSGFNSDARQLVRSADDLSDAVRRDLPSIALLKANQTVVSQYHLPVTLMVSAPDLTMDLPDTPIQEGSTWDLCRRAFPFQAIMILRASRDIPSSKPRRRFIAWSMAAVIPYCLSMGVEPYEMSNGDLGSRPFQIGVAVHGEPLPALGERGVVLATYLMDDGASRSIAELRDFVSRFALAQSEYYFNGVQDENEFLWRMQWRARIRRFSLRGGAVDALLDIGFLDTIVR
jgi:hypothetical protein